MRRQTSLSLRTPLRARLCLLLVSVTALALAACSDQGGHLPEPIPLPQPASRDVSFHEDVRPILETKCLTCHSCYDAPCQLKLETAEGLLRGGSHEEVYNGTRTTAKQPTRLGMDAEGEAAWRELGFHSVLERDGEQDALLYNMLALAKKRPFQPNTRLPDDIELGITRVNQCVAPDEFDDYASKHPLEGMPLGTTGLTDSEFALISAWLQQGAVIPPEDNTPDREAQTVLDDWEAWLNGKDKRQQLVSRWLFEHLFLAHLYLADLTGEDERPAQFFQVVRSHTPPGKPIEPIATPRPNAPPEGDVYYRLRPVGGTIVHKRHITFALDNALRGRIDELFFADDWRVENLPGYGYTERSNPFLTFAAIPPRARYQFMLDHAEYFTRTFIRGPVCRGQIATDVIRDHFWALFQDPDDDIFITNGSYHNRVAPLLGLPGQNDNLLESGSNWSEYRDRRNRYMNLRAQAYAATYQEGPSIDHIWDGDGHNTNALLTIFRHHDSATVERGLIGRVPQTIWWMDYPLFERTYYELVVNFDVFGNVSHQLQTRLYFDLIRNGSEHNFLRLLPPGERKITLNDWYRGMGRLKSHVTYAPLDDSTPSAEDFATDAPKQELGLRLMERFANINVMAEDPLNRCDGDDCGRADQPAWIQEVDTQLSFLSSVPASHLPGIKRLPETSFVRVRHDDGERTVYTLVRNRAHSNVAFMLGEEARYEPDNDYLTVYPGTLGSYPNFIFDVPAEEVPSFSQQLGRIEKDDEFDALIELWGVRRTHPDFWAILHDFTDWQMTHRPRDAGIFDINRFENL